MPNQQTDLTTLPKPEDAIIQHDRIAFLADKYGVSKIAVMMAMSITGGDDCLLQEILKQNRFVR